MADTALLDKLANYDDRMFGCSHSLYYYYIDHCAGARAIERRFMLNAAGQGPGVDNYDALTAALRRFVRELPR